MPRVQVHHVIEPVVGNAVRGLLDATERATGRQALSDHLAVDLARGGTDGFVAVTSIDGATGDIVGYAQASTANETYSLELVVDPGRSGEIRSILGDLVGAALTAIGGQGGGIVNWMISAPAVVHEEIADDLGMEKTRTLFQMRRSLPTGMEVRIETRSGIVGADDAAWLVVNNLAFARHGEQGGWTIETLRRRQAEPWFRDDDVRVHEREGQMTSFCWTKVHPATDREARLGEIYVIAVHPDFHGQGLGRQMTLAGLDHLAQQGITTAMLWVDGDNTVAVALYDRLGFSVHASTVAFTIEVPAAAAAT